MASSLTWWRRWGHAEVALYPHKPTQVSCLPILTCNFSTVGSGEACRGQLQIKRTICSFKGPEWNKSCGVLVCALSTKEVYDQTKTHTVEVMLVMTDIIILSDP